MTNTRLVIVTGGSAGLGHALLEVFNTQYSNQILVNVARRDCAIKADTARNNQVINLQADLHQPHSIAELQHELRNLVQKHQPNELYIIHNAGQVTPIGLSTQISDVEE